MKYLYALHCAKVFSKPQLNRKPCEQYSNQIARKNKQTKKPFTIYLGYYL